LDDDERKTYNINEMRIFGLEIKKADKRSITSDDPWLPEYLSLGDPYSSVSVNSPEMAMKLSAVYRSVSILSGTIASLPLYPRRRMPDKHFEIDEENNLYTILRWKCNKRDTFYNLMENAICQVLLDGNAYIFQKYKGSELSELILCQRGSVSYDEYTDKYIISDIRNGINGVFNSWQVIHLRNKNLDGGKIGLSTIQYASRILNLSANADEQTLSGIKSGNKMKGFISGGSITTGMGKAQDKYVDIVRDRLEEELASGRSFMRLPGEVEFHPFTITPADAQLLENRKFGVFDICRFFGVHPDKVFVEQTSNYKASENSQTSFMTDTLQPLLTQIETEFSTKLIPLKLVGRKEIILFDRVALYQLDPKGASTYYKNMFEIGGLTTNEIRLLEHRNTVKGGDVTFVSTNVAPIDSPKIFGGVP